MKPSWRNNGIIICLRSGVVLSIVPIIKMEERAAANVKRKYFERSRHRLICRLRVPPHADIGLVIRRRRDGAVNKIEAHLDCLDERVEREIIEGTKIPPLYVLKPSSKCPARYSPRCPAGFYA